MQRILNIFSKKFRGLFLHLAAKSIYLGLLRLLSISIPNQSTDFLLFSIGKISLSYKVSKDWTVNFYWQIYWLNVTMWQKGIYLHQTLSILLPLFKISQGYFSTVKKSLCSVLLFLFSSGLKANLCASLLYHWVPAASTNLQVTSAHQNLGRWEEIN